MTDKVLYFPYIKVPETKWFTQVLLYWDEVGSIVPREYIYRPEKLGSYMRDLVKAELVKQILPSDYIYKIPRFEEAFLQLVERNESVIKRQTVDLDSEETFRIHIEKFGDDLARQLSKMGLARSVGYPWFQVESVTADLFMAYLSSVLGRLEDLQMCPITDHPQYFSAFTKFPKSKPKAADVISELRIAVLHRILPVPAGVISVSELANFKARYINQLSHLRRSVESALFDMSLILDTQTRNERLNLFKRNLEEEIAELKARMLERKWPQLNLGTVCCLLAAAIPGAEAVTTGDTASALKALPGLVAAIYFAFKETPNQSEIMQSPLAYAALFQRRFR